MTSRERRVVACGIDGYSNGWVGALLVLDPYPHAELELFADIDAVATWRAVQMNPPPVAIDVPIGLPVEVGFRECDLEARARLGARRNSVFQVPDRSLLQFATFEELQAAVATRKSSKPKARGLSIQAFGICRKIAEVDSKVRADPDSSKWLFEMHPEVSFALMAGGLLANKKSAAGSEQRIKVLTRYFPDARTLMEDAHDKDGDVAHDDVLDALAALWTALRHRAGKHELLGGAPDHYGVPMRMII